jgi:hypothetical protein
MNKAVKVDVTKINAADYLDILECCSAAKQTPFIWGPPGIAKSAIAQQYANMLGVAFVDIRLSQMEAADLRGIPYPVTEGGITGVQWSPPLVMPSDLNISHIVHVEYPGEVEFSFAKLNPLGSNNIRYVTDIDYDVMYVGENNAVAEIVSKTLSEIVVRIVETNENNEVVLVNEKPNLLTGKVRVKLKGSAKAVVAMEELNSAQVSIQVVAYQLIHDRRVGEYIVPEFVDLMGMGNSESDRGVTFKMPSPIENRLIHFELEPSHSEWQEWAISAGIHPKVLGFLYHFKDFLFQFDPRTSSRGFCTPRSWHILSNMLHAFDKRKKPVSYKVLKASVVGAIGQGVGVQFLSHNEVADKLPLPEKVLSGKITRMPRGAEATQYSFAMCMTLIFEMNSRIKSIRDKYGKGNYAGSSEYKVWLKEADTFFCFIMDNFLPEINIMAASICFGKFQLPFITDKNSMPNFIKFSDHYGDFMND